MRTVFLRVSIIFLAIISFVSCKSITSNRMFETPEDYEYTEFSSTQKEYVIQPYDELTLMVYSNKASDLVDIKNIQFNRNNQINYKVEKDGMAKLPTIGWVKLKGLTVKEAQQYLEEQYKTYTANPFVYLSVSNRRVIVFANGSEKGVVINFTHDNFTLIEALAQSGGISDFGKAYKIKLLRGNLNKPEVYKFNIRSLEEIKKANFQICSNDIIYVESRPRYASKVLREITPYLSLFSSAFTIYILLSKK